MRKPLIPWYSLPGSQVCLEKVWFENWFKPSWSFQLYRDHQTGNRRLIAVIMGVGDWADQDGEYYRHDLAMP